MANVDLKVKSGLKVILDDLEALKKKAEEVNSSLGETGRETSKSLGRSKRETEGFFMELRSFGRRTADQLKRDFKSLISIESLGAGLKISSQFKESIAETLDLTAAIRKLGPVFGITGQEFTSFQKKLTDGLGEIGLSSEVATKALEGLSQTQVRGQDNLMAYTRASGMLASIGREQGREGEISRGMAGVIQARGQDPNDRKNLDELTESLRKVFIATGKPASQALADMERLFAAMPQDLRKALSSTSLGNLAAVQAAGGPNVSRFLEEYLGANPITRMAFDAQGGKGLFGNEGLDLDKFKNFSRDILGRIGFDPRSAAQTLGLSEQAAEGFVRLAESLDRVQEAQKRAQQATGNLEESYRNALSPGEAFRANINRIKAFLSEPLSFLTNAATDALTETSKTDVGAGAVVAGAGVLGALLTGGGLAGIGKGLFGTIARGAAAEQITGQKTMPVYVTNFGELALAGIGGGALGGGKGLGLGLGMGALGSAVAGLGLAAGGAYLAGEGASMLREKGLYDASTERGLAYTVGGDNAVKIYDKLYDLLISMNNKILGTDYKPIIKTPYLNESPGLNRGRQN